MAKQKQQTPKKTATVSSLAQTSSWRIVREALGELRLHAKRYALLLGVVSVPTALIGLSTQLSADVSVDFYLKLGSLFMTTALLWAVAHQRDLVGLAVRRSYYEGSALLLRLILVIIMLAAMMLPAAIGLSLYALGTAPGSGATLPVYLLLGGLSFILALPSIFWLIRFGLSVFAIADGDAPLAALRNARRLTMGRFWLVARRLVLCLILVLLLLLVPAVVFVTLSYVTGWAFFDALLSLSLSMLAVPVGTLAFYRIYRILQEG